MKTHEYNNAVYQFSTPLMRFAVNFLRNEEEAKDIVQDVFEKLWLNREKVELGKIKAWLFTCANNAMLNYIQKKNRSCEFNMTLHEKGSYDQTHYESKQAIQHVVSILPPLQKSILLLRDLEGYAYEEIGEILDISASQVKVYLFRARMKMKKQLTQLNELA